MLNVPLGCYNPYINQITRSIWNRLRDSVASMNSFSIKDILHDSHDFRAGLSYLDKTPKLSVMADSTLQHYSNQPSFKTQSNGKYL